MTGSLEDTIAKWFVVEHRFAPDYARETAVEVVAMVRAAGVVPAEPFASDVGPTDFQANAERFATEDET